MSLSQIELVSVRVEWESLWVNLRQDNKVSDSNMAVVNQTWQNSRWIPSSRWVRWMSEVFCSEWLNPRWLKSRWLPWSSLVTMNEWSFFCSKCLIPRWQNSWWLTSSSWVRMNEFESDWISLSQTSVQNSWIQDSRIHDGCHHQINQMALVWIRVRVEWESFWVKSERR